MELHDIKQGSSEWLALRLNYFTASEATAMMGDSPYTSRDQLLHQKKTGSTPEVTEHQQRQFDRGHAAEAGARPVLEKGVVGEDLFPVTGTRTVDGLPLLASFDGLTMDKSLVFEHSGMKNWLPRSRAKVLSPPTTGSWNISYWSAVQNVCCLSALMVVRKKCATSITAHRITAVMP